MHTLTGFDLAAYAAGNYISFSFEFLTKLSDEDFLYHLQHDIALACHRNDVKFDTMFSDLRSKNTIMKFYALTTEGMQSATFVRLSDNGFTGSWIDKVFLFI